MRNHVHLHHPDATTKPVRVFPNQAAFDAYLAGRPPEERLLVADALLRRSFAEIRLAWYRYEKGALPIVTGYHIAPQFPPPLHVPERNEFYRIP